MHLDTLAQISVDPRVPSDERRDINAELWKTYARHLDYPDMDEVRSGLDELWTHRGMQKATLRLEGTWVEGKPPQGHPREHTSILHLNEFGIIDPGDGRSRWLEKKSITGFEFLRDVVNSVDLIGAILQTRQRQIEPFLRPERDQGPLGFRFVRADGERVGDRDKAPIRHLEQMLMNSGDVPDYFERRRLRRDGLHGFVNKIIFDTLAADACPIELSYTRGQKLSGWYSVPFTTVRLCSESGYEGRDQIQAVQVYESVPRTAYTYKDLIYEIRNPRSDLHSGGYGYAETEMVVRALTGYLNAVTFNAAGLDRNATPRGVMTLLGKYTDEQLQIARRQIKAMLTGPSNRFTFPIIASEEKGSGAVWTPMDNFDEMFFSQWLVFIVSIVCAAFGIDPQEIHFDSFGVRGNPIGGKNDTAERFSMSRDKGLVPLLAFIERVLNLIVNLIDPRYKLEFVGLHEEDEGRKQIRIQATRTTDEIREIDGADKHPDPLIGNAPVNQAHLGLYMQSQGLTGASDGGYDTGYDDPYEKRDDDDRRPKKKPERDDREPAEPVRTKPMTKAAAVVATKPFMVVIEKGITREVG